MATQITFDRKRLTNALKALLNLLDGRVVQVSFESLNDNVTVDLVPDLKKAKKGNP
jgi:16S rRNA C1402 N4-methylase RsmH